MADHVVGGDAALDQQDRKRIIIADGEQWIVREIAAPVLDRRGGRHLLFESANGFRRLRLFPADWFELGDDELYALNPRMQTDQPER